MKTLIILSILIVSGFSLQAQSNLDSLYAVWQDEAQADSSRVKAYNKYVMDGFLLSKPDSAFLLANQLIAFADEHNYEKAQAKAFFIQGLSHYFRGNFKEGLDYFQQCLKLYEKLGDKFEVARTLNSIGGIYINQSNYTQALNYYEKSLKIFEEMEYKEGISGILTNMGLIYDAQGNYTQAIDSYRQALKISEEVGDKPVIAKALNNIGTTYKSLSKYTVALDYYQQSLKMKEEIGDIPGVVTTLNGIGLIYISLEKNTQALDYFQQALEIAEEIGDKLRIGSLLNNIGLIYKNQGNYTEALDYYRQSLKIIEETGDKKVIASNLTNIGNIYQFQGNYTEALDYFQQALEIAEEIGDKNSKATSLLNIASLSADQGMHNIAIDRCQSVYEIGKEIGDLSKQKEACSCLYVSYKALDNCEKTLLYHEEYFVLEDSLEDKEIVDLLQQMELKNQAYRDSMAAAEKARIVEAAYEVEIRKKNNTRNLFLAGGLFFLFLAGGLYSRNRYIKKSRDIISKERDRSDDLLLNILPAEIAEELKVKGSADARQYEQASILFTDFKDFTQMSEKLNATDLVEELNYCFKSFDAICEKYEVEKIKTIGDSYMAAGGLPVRQKSSTKNTVLAALEMAQFIIDRNYERTAEGKEGFTMRTGIHTGKVVAGIVGVKKFQYDVWGDTVNTASRMESSGEVGKVNISQFTYEAIKDDPQFSFQHRGKVEAKGKGEIDMWFVEFSKIEN